MPALDRDDLAGPGDDLLAAAAELERALEHLEALALVRVDVRGGDGAVRLDGDLDLDELAVGLGGGRRKWIVSPVTGFSIVSPARMDVGVAVIVFVSCRGSGCSDPEPLRQRALALPRGELVSCWGRNQVSGACG